MWYKRQALLFILAGVIYGLPGIAQIPGRYDTVHRPASLQYKTSALGRLISGSNYRKLWETPVAMPVFRLKETTYIIKELGGGMQTKSLSLLDKNKKEWVLRTVDKDAGRAVPKNLRHPIVLNFVQDMTSAAHPYAPLVVGELARFAGIIASRPQLYFVPDDISFGTFKDVFANTICFLEEKEPTPDNSSTENTAKVMKEIFEENDHLVLQEAVLKARLLDMLVGDWDRHSEQWRWGMVDSGVNKYYYAIPRDRDQAFFWTNGLLPKFIRLFAMKHINGFKKESRGLKNLNFKSWQFDKTFLNELDAESWRNVILGFQNSLTDDVIERAVKKLPQEIFSINGPALENRLKNRRNTLLKNAIKYYQFISSTVNISGTEENELFEIKQSNKSNTGIIISVYRVKEGQVGKKIYERIFEHNDTKYIILAGLGGDDQFIIDQRVASKIKIKIEGGEGKDFFNLKGKIKTRVSDPASDKK